MPGVKHVLDVQLSTRPLVPAKERISPGAAKSEGQEEAGSLVEPALSLVEQKRLDIPPDTLLCSLEHEINLIELT